MPNKLLIKANFCDLRNVKEGISLRHKSRWLKEE